MSLKMHITPPGPKVNRGWLIDPFVGEISPALYTGPNSLRRAIGCDLFDRVPFDDSHDVWIDEGLHKRPGKFFAIKGFPYPLAGRGFVLGFTENGKTVGAKLELDEVIARTLMLTVDPITRELIRLDTGLPIGWAGIEAWAMS